MNSFTLLLMLMVAVCLLQNICAPEDLPEYIGDSPPSSHAADELNKSLAAQRRAAQKRDRERSNGKDNTGRKYKPIVYD
ncbi:hypothetical protein DdX_06068 [Ditylenchus destructor]|uniref:Uncharacterized protein n=1 Tax=Ditylenchus destructor TaxID=166010 RepID=A0AAD4N5K0_9BILA|nr:hypothetical protein DdX_06068 [Ditylenchus destructor]